MRVFVYFNLHRKCWSIKALEGENKGRVIGHAKGVYLSDVRPKVSEAGRQRVLREKRKNVHAGLTGNLMCVTDDSNLWRRYPYIGSYHHTLGATRITYNPYRCGHFTLKNDHTTAVKHVGLAILLDRDVHCYQVQTETMTEQQELFAA